MNYKIFKCRYCDRGSPCYCIIKQEITKIYNTDIRQCLVGGISEWKEANNDDFNEIKYIIN